MAITGTRLSEEETHADSQNSSTSLINQRSEGSQPNRNAFGAFQKHSWNPSLMISHFSTFWNPQHMQSYTAAQVMQTLLLHPHNRGRTPKLLISHLPFGHQTHLELWYHGSGFTDLFEDCVLLILQLHAKAKDLMLHPERNDPCSSRLLLLQQERTELQIRSIRQVRE